MGLMWLGSTTLSSALITACLGVYLLVPLIIKFFPKVITSGTFLNFVCPPHHKSKLCTPEKIWKNVLGVTNYTITSEKLIKLGLWHIAPVNTFESLANAEKVILYCHGNAFHRGYGHRLEIYKIFRREGFHVVTFDYRGFGDSTGIVSEEGVIHDTIEVYKWLLEQISPKKCKIYIWGHSLGTFVASKACLAIQNDPNFQQPQGIFLESTFTNFDEMVHGYPLSKICFKIYPGKWFENIFYGACMKNNLQCNTRDAIMNLNNHIMMFHAQDDITVPYRLGVQLFHEMLGNKHCKAKSVKFVSFKAKHGYRHNHMYKSPKIPEFMQKMENATITEDKFLFLEL